jgi:SET domain-containing protein
MRIDDDLTVRLTAQRAIAPGEPISVDYELLEEDMVVQGVDFPCSCGAAVCRGRIVGARRRALDAAAR